MHARAVDALARLPVMKGVPRAALVDLCLVAPPVRLRKGDVVLAEGEPADVALLVVDGSLAAVLGEADTRRRLGSIGPGEVVGEQALFFRDGRRNATVVAEEDTTALLLSPEVLAQAGTNPAVVALERRLLEVLSARVRHTHTLLRQAVAPDPRATDRPRSFRARLRQLAKALPGGPRSAS